MYEQNNYYEGDGKEVNDVKIGYIIERVIFD